MLLEHGATTSREERCWFAKEAFAFLHYDSAIFNYFDGGEGSAFRCAVEEQKQLRYGENPHQKGYFLWKSGCDVRPDSWKRNL